MPRFLDAILPRQADNDYRGGPIPFYGFCLVAATHVFSSTVHFLKPDSGVNSIASIIVFEGTPDPNHIIYMFSAVGGVTQMMWVMLFGLVLWRYRNLVPLMLAFIVLETLFGFVVGWMHPLTPEYFEYTPPAKVAAVPKLVVCGTLLFLALRRTVRSRDAGAAEPAMA